MSVDFIRKNRPKVNPKNKMSCFGQNKLQPDLVFRRAVFSLGRNFGFAKTIHGQSLVLIYTQNLVFDFGTLLWYPKMAYGARVLCLFIAKTCGYILALYSGTRKCGTGPEFCAYLLPKCVGIFWHCTLVRAFACICF